MAAAAADRTRVRRVELAMECVTIAHETERLVDLLAKRVAVMSAQTRALAGELDGVDEERAS